MMIIDAHYHLEERMEPVKEIITRMKTHDIERVALMAAPCAPFHVESILVEKFSALARRMLTSKLKILNNIALSAYRNSVTKDGKFSIPGKKYDICHKPDNESVERVIKKYPHKFYGWIFINPREPDAVNEIEKRAGDKSWIGVKTHPCWHQYPLQLLDDAAALCAEKGLPMLMHLGGNKENGNFRYLPERHPNLKIIYAHAGIPFFREIWDYSKNKNNIFFDLSSPYLNENLRRKAVFEIGYEKCIHGTDGPFGYPSSDGFYDHGRILSEILRLPIPDSSKEMILGKNFLVLAGIQ
ncbi:MAG: amidohydrolase family protein [bacterium]|nr:amidohydrolase family protein [bacterium]